MYWPKKISQRRRVFDLGNRFLPQKNEESGSELVGTLSPGSWQDGVGALDLAGVDPGTHTWDYFRVQSCRRETYALSRGSQPSLWFLLIITCALRVGVVHVESSLGN